MKTIEQLLRYLLRPDVAEVALINDRLPCVHVGDSFDPIDEEAPTADRILEMLVTVGGSRYVDNLGSTPRQWSARLEGVGTVTVTASMPGHGEVQARFALARRDERARPGRSLSGATARGSLKPGRISVKPALRTSRTSGKPSSRRSLRALVLDKSSLPPASRSVPPDRARRQQIPTKPSLRISSRRRSTVPSPRPPAPVDRVPEATRLPPSTRPARKSRPVSTQPEPSTLAELERLLSAARDAGASDLHVVAERPMLVRIAGELRPRGDVIDAASVERMLLAAVPSRLRDTLERVGSCDFALAHPELGRFRVNVGRQQTGLQATMRLIPKEVPTLEGLRMPPGVAAATRHHQGFIVVTGPTGHGKTTTLAAIVDVLNQKSACHIITVEDPIEFVHPPKQAIMSQREVGTHTRSFETALRAALREDPDVIVVGELRDTETVRMAVSASETGHLVLGTMNTPSAAKTIDRLIDLFPPADQPQVRTSLAAGLRLIVSQRLVPGVDRTHQHAAVELLPGSVPLSALIRENKTFQIPSLQQRSKALGIVRLDDSLAELVRGLHVQLEAARAFADSPQELETLVASQRGPRPSASL